MESREYDFPVYEEDCSTICVVDPNNNTVALEFVVDDDDTEEALQDLSKRYGKTYFYYINGLEWT